MEKQEDTKAREADQRVRAVAHNYVTNHQDSEVRRMYGHHLRTFMDGYKQGQSELREENERLKAIISDVWQDMSEANLYTDAWYEVDKIVYPQDQETTT
jgi:hypothetical protein